MSKAEIVLFTIFVSAIIFFSFRGVMRTEAKTPNKLNMTTEEVDYVINNLKKRSAADCVLTRADYGFVCKEMGSDKVFKVRMK